MSLIHNNPWLINKLLQVVEKSENKFSKRGQASSDQQTTEALKALLNNLRDQITPLKESADEVAHATGTANLVSGNMDSMGDLVEWLVKNSTKIGSTVIVYPGNISRPNEDYGYFKIEPGTEIVVPLARPDRSVVAYWINTEGLKRYLISLQADPKLKNNVMFQVQLLKLIQDANKQLDVNIGENYKEELPDTTIVDNVPNPLDPERWEISGVIPLTIHDLKSVDTLGDWVSSKRIGIKKEDKIIDSNDIKNFKLCDVIILLIKRAKGMMRTSSTRVATDTYLKMVVQIGTQSGCNMSGNGQTNQQGQSKQQGQEEEASSVTLGQIADLLPFNSNYIDFEQIKAFVDNYAAWAQANNRPQINVLKEQVDKAIDRSNEMLSSPGVPIQSSSLSPSRFHLLAKAPNMDKILVSNLFTIISVAGRIFQDFTTIYQRGGQDAHTLRQQIAPGGPQQRNLNDIDMVMNNFK